MPLLLFNTLYRRKEPFSPERDNTVRMYNCGPTVYSAPHIGNMRAYLFADLLRRTLELEGWQVTQVINITDVGHLTSQADTGEDKVEAAARQAGETAWDIAKRYTDAFMKDLAALHIEPPSAMPRATDHIPEQIELIKIIEAKGYTYRLEDGLYFDTSRFPNYGALGGQKLDEKLAGTRVEVTAGKRQAADFALWKFSPPGEQRHMEWPSPWGMGFPGWHIECSAMSRKYLGQPFDIHTGGIDHIPVHHANEIAQSEAAFGVPLTRFWLHSEFLVMKEKMSKSLGNVLTISDLVSQGFHPLAYRLFALSTHYRSPLTFSIASLAEAQRNLFAFHAFLQRLSKAIIAPAAGKPENGKKLMKLHEKFRSALADDLNAPVAVATAYQFMKSVNGLLDTQALSAASRDAALAFLADFEKTYALTDAALLNPKIPAAVQKLADERNAFRAKKEYEAADKIRQQLIDRGYALEDTVKGTKLHPLPIKPNG